jgi:hypothetical protein
MVIGSQNFRTGDNSWVFASELPQENFSQEY